MPRTNWAGNHRYRARELHRPRSVEELRTIVRRAPRLRVLGSRHSFTDIADSDALVSLEELPAELALDRAAGIAWVPGAIRYGELAARLDREGLALANLASLPHISVAGAIATATHGSGMRNGNLATAVVALELVRSDGELVTLARGDAEFDGAVVNLGAVGAVTRVALAVQPAYELAQHVYEGLAWEALYEHFDEIFGAGYSVSVFTRWGATTDQVWVKRRASDPPAPESLFGAPEATEDRHPILGLDPVNCTPQLGRPGPWLERLPHFRMGFTPSSGEEIQSEYHLPPARAIDAIEAVRGLAELLRPLVLVSEIRRVAADELWLSPQYRQDTVALHFTWARRQADVERALVAVERELMALGARPHWGKLFLAGRLRERYPRAEDFLKLAARLDPRGAFRNPWFERVL